MKLSGWIRRINPSLVKMKRPHPSPHVCTLLAPAPSSSSGKLRPASSKTPAVLDDERTAWLGDERDAPSPNSPLQFVLAYECKSKPSARLFLRGSGQPYLTSRMCHNWSFQASEFPGRFVKSWRVEVGDRGAPWEIISQTLHVCHVCLHWDGFWGQCRHIWHTWSVWVSLERAE